MTSQFVEFNLRVNLADSSCTVVDAYKSRHANATSYLRSCPDFTEQELAIARNLSNNGTVFRGIGPRELEERQRQIRAEKAQFEAFTSDSKRFDKGVDALANLIDRAVHNRDVLFSGVTLSEIPTFIEEMVKSAIPVGRPSQFIVKGCKSLGHPAVSLAVDSVHAMDEYGKAGNVSDGLIRAATHMAVATASGAVGTLVIRKGLVTIGAGIAMLFIPATAPAGANLVVYGMMQITLGRLILEEPTGIVVRQFFETKAIQDIKREAVAQNTSLQDLFAPDSAWNWLDQQLTKPYRDCLSGATLKELNVRVGIENYVQRKSNMWDTYISPRKTTEMDVYQLLNGPLNPGGISIGTIDGGGSSPVTPDKFITLCTSGDGLFEVDGNLYTANYSRSEAHILMYVVLELYRNKMESVFFTYYSDETKAAEASKQAKIDLNQFMVLFLNLGPSELLYSDLMRCARVDDIFLKGILATHLLKAQVNDPSKKMSSLSAYIEPRTINVTKRVGTATFPTVFHIEPAETTVMFHSATNCFGSVNKDDVTKTLHDYRREGNMTSEEFLRLNGTSSDLLNAINVARSDDATNTQTWKNQESSIINTPEHTLVRVGMSLLAVIVEFLKDGYGINPRQKEYCRQLLAALPTKLSEYPNLPIYDVIPLVNRSTNTNVPIKGGINLVRSRLRTNIWDDLSPLEGTVFRTTTPSRVAAVIAKNRLNHVCSRCLCILPPAARKVFCLDFNRGTGKCLCHSCVPASQKTVMVTPNLQQLEAGCRYLANLATAFAENPHMFCFFEMFDYRVAGSIPTNQYCTTFSDAVLTLAYHKMFQELPSTVDVHLSDVNVSELYTSAVPLSTKIATLREFTERVNRAVVPKRTLSLFSQFMNADLSSKMASNDLSAVVVLSFANRGSDVIKFSI